MHVIDNIRNFQHSKLFTLIAVSLSIMSQHTDERKKNSMMNDNFSDVITENMKNS
jgi:hypothetical protein